MESSIGEFIISIVRVDSIGSIVIRAIIWLILVTIIAYGTAKGKQMTRIKAEAGFFLLFVFLTGAVIYLVFGIIPTVTTTPQTYIFQSIIALSGPALLRLNKTSPYFLQT